MPDQYSVKINRQEGAVEVVGPDRDWVDAKLTQLSPVYEAAPGDESSEQNSSTGAKNTGVRKTTSRKPAARANPGDTKKPKARRGAGGGRAERNAELQAVFTKNLRDKFDAYVADRRTAWDKNDPNQAAIIATFLLKELEWAAIDKNDLYTVYAAMGLPTPSNMDSQLNNAKQRYKYFGPAQDGKFPLSHGGERFGEHESRNQ